MGPEEKPPPYSPQTFQGLGYGNQQPGYQGTVPPAYQPAPNVGYPGPFQGAAPPNYGTVHVPAQMVPPAPAGGPGHIVPVPNTVVTIQPAENIILVGGCPCCRVGVLEDDFTCLGILLAIWFFPLGILCCLALRQRRCPNCGATFA